MEIFLILQAILQAKNQTTVVPVFSGPRDERPPTMYGHFSEVPIDFQRICPLDQRTPTERGRGQFFLIDSHTDLVFFLQNKQHFIVVYDIFKDGVAHFVKTSCTAQCMLGMLFLSNHKRPRATRASSTHSCFYIPFYILFDKHAYLVMASEGKRQVLSCGLCNTHWKCSHAGRRHDSAGSCPRTLH